MKTTQNSLLSIVTPAYKEAENLPILHRNLTQVLEATGMPWEWIIVDDHSTDETFAVVSDMAKEDSRIRGIRLARNAGSHVAMACGLHNAQGNCAVVMAADMQDPPEVIPKLLLEWSGGVQVVWATRNQREGEKTTTRGFSRLYYFLMRRFVGLQGIPANGADFFLMDERVLDAFRQFHESNVSILALISWMGFRQSNVAYDKKARLHGTSGWSMKKKVKLLLDSITSFTYFPIRLMSYLGFFVATLGFLHAASVLPGAFAGRLPEGWMTLIIVVSVLGGLQMIMMGVLGEYVWRALDESRHRPRYLIEANTDPCAMARPAGLSHKAQ
jgi:polyisoprenyl-phosphate glycosyltransferase